MPILTHALISILTIFVAGATTSERVELSRATDSEGRLTQLEEQLTGPNGAKIIRETSWSAERILTVTEWTNGLKTLHREESEDGDLRIVTEFTESPTRKKITTIGPERTRHEFFEMRGGTLNRVRVYEEPTPSDSVRPETQVLEAYRRENCCEDCETTQAPPTDWRQLCPGHENLQDRIQCENGSINPFSVLRIKELSRACRYYWLNKAKMQAVATGRQLPKNDPARKYLATGARLLRFEADCREHKMKQGVIAPEHSELIRKILENPAEQEEQRYCQAVGRDRCADMGGIRKAVLVRDKEEPEYGKERDGCVVSGMILDESCLALDARRFKQLKSALSDVFTKGPSCLRSIKGGATVTAEVLLDHKRSEKPLTQLCCGGNSGCSSSKLPQPERAPGAPNARTKSISKYGTIVLFKRAFDSSNNLSGTIFHEFLHRIGVAKNPNHNGYEDFPMQIRSCNTGCAAEPPVWKKLPMSARKSKRVESWKREYSRLTGEKDFEWEDLRGDAEKNAKACLCIGMSACNPQLPLAFDGSHLTHDPVYACTSVCFPKGNAKPWPEAKKLCHAAADAGGFTGATDIRLHNGRSLCDRKLGL